MKPSPKDSPPTSNWYYLCVLISILIMLAILGTLSLYVPQTLPYGLMYGCFCVFYGLYVVPWSSNLLYRLTFGRRR